MYINENLTYLAGAIIEAIVFDYRLSRKDTYRRQALLKWFDTSYGDAVCGIAGVDPEYIKNSIQTEVAYEERTKTYRADDYKGT